ncbi:SDR family oxidoreductase [Salinarimonas chemoclinalis]|uniref:SDR family oxidoreductase n=1 Tax=Salinarimonas chemoclinalis TaxID=3241599 RepID=UPI0035575620
MTSNEARAKAADAPVAIVTAAGRGIGAGIARELAGRGWRVAVMSPSGAAQAVAAEIGGLSVVGSVTEPDDIERLVAATVERWGRVDAVVNNTGHPPKGDLVGLSDETWRHGFDLVVLSVTRLARLTTPLMLKRGRGAIVTISSFTARAPDLAMPVSSTLRAALGAWTRLYAERYAEHGIRANAILPGFVDSYPLDEARRAAIPAGRYATVAEVARTAAFLVSDESSYITGQSLLVDGGLVRASA